MLTLELDYCATGPEQPWGGRLRTTVRDVKCDLCVHNKVWILLYQVYTSTFLLKTLQKCKPEYEPLYPGVVVRACSPVLGVLG